MLYILHFLMTAIRKTTLQVAYFQHFTTLTTDLCTSNDRFGLNSDVDYTNCNINTPVRDKKSQIKVGNLAIYLYFYS